MPNPIYTDPNIEQYPFTVRNDTSVNPVPADAIACPLVGGALEVYLIASKQYGGALVSTERPVPIVNGMPAPYLQFSYQKQGTAASVLFGGQEEADVKYAFPAAPNASTEIQNVYDGSTQNNKGSWQIDTAAGSWIDTGYLAPLAPANFWTPVAVNYKFDYLAKTCSVLSIQQGDNPPFVVAAALQAVPAQTTNWASYAWGAAPQPLVVVQLQLNCAIPGAYVVRYQNIQLQWGTVPF